ncbi:S8 family serine peptidase [Sedimentibacter sp. zth1]|uniref:S8 family serine peptidase n=1 Tax=Sedimentibacter sp. zth1 TaxID=2816908 RepID=UPI001A91FCED|nr:S8 family serine peptidase [Sedimentibacter sp. zth1]QSX04825.1 S8 family serine peptidase [Sedimentibacter sp. zth1]
MCKFKKIIAKILTVAILVAQVTCAPNVFAENVSHEKNEMTKKIVALDSQRSNEKTDIIIKYKSESSNSKMHNNIKSKLKLKKFIEKKNFKSKRISILEIDKTDDISSVIEELKKDPNVEYAQPNYPLTITSTPTDEKFLLQWGLLNSGQEVRGKIGRSTVDINALNAWDLSTGENVVIGVLDSGIDITHSDLKDNVYVNQKEIPGNGIDDDGNGYIDDINGWNFSDDMNTVYSSPEEDVHGTYIAGIIAASANNSGVVGVAPKVKILPLKFINATTGYTSDAIEAIEYAKNMGVNIINCSFGGTDNNIALKEAMADSGMLFVCAAGNRGGYSKYFPVYPASFDIPNVISVGAVDCMGILATFSNRGINVDVAAPGTSVLSTIPEQGYDYYSGTSVSAAYVSGIAALAKSYLPQSSIDEIKERIINNVVKCDALKYIIGSEGRVDAFATLTNIPQTLPDTYNGLGAGDDILAGSGEGSQDTWYTMDERARNAERFHYGEGGVNPASGNYSVTCTDMSIPAPGFQVNFSRTYNSRDEKPTMLGRGWTFGFEGRAYGGENTVYICLPDGSTHVFNRNGDKYVPEGTRASYVKFSNSSILYTKDQYKYGFNEYGYMTSMEDKNGNRISINYQNGKIDNIVDTVGRQYKLEYYPTNGLLKSITDPELRQVIYEYNYKNLLVKVIDPNSQTLQYEYDSSKYLTKLIDGNAHVFQTLKYSHNMGDAQNKICKTIDAAGETWVYTYDVTNRRTTISNSENKKWTYEFDVAMYTIRVQDPEGRSEVTSYWFNSNINHYGDIKSKIDRNGNTTLFDVDNKGNITGITNPDQITDPNKSKKQFFYDEKNNLIKEINEVGHKTFYIYDSETKKLLLKKVKPLNGTDEYDDKNSDSTYNNKFAITTYEYYTKSEANQLFSCNVGGLLKSTTDPIGNTETYTYDNYGNIKTYKNKTGDITTYEYNKIGWKTKETSPKLEVISWDYDKNGNIIREKHPDGGVTRIVYDNAGYKILEVTPEQYEADKDNLQTSQYTGLIGTKYKWYDNGYLEYTEDALGNKTKYTYDKFGNKISELKPNNAYYRFEYDVLNRPTKVYFKDMTKQSPVEILLSETSYSILLNGNSQKTDIIYYDKDGQSKSTTITITDYAGRVVEQQYPDFTKTKTIYNYDGTVKEEISANGASTIYNYDGMGNVSDIWTPVSIKDGNIKYSWTNFSYDKNGNILKQEIGKQLVELNEVTNDTYYTLSKYDKDRIIEQTGSDGKKSSFEYDVNGNISKEIRYVINSKIKEQIVYPTNIEKPIVDEIIDNETKYILIIETKETEYQYNYMKKPTVVTNYVRSGDIFGESYKDDNLKSITTKYSYDKNGNIKSITQPDGTVTVNNYDILDRLLSTSTTGKNSSGQTMTVTASKTYTWNGKVETSTDANNNTTRYFYDTMGNLVKTIDAKNNISLIKYDLAGRKVAEVSPKNVVGTDINSMERTEYTYDSMSRVKTKAVVFKKWNMNNITYNWSKDLTRVVIAAYEYDILGNITKKLDAMGFAAGTGTTDDEKIYTGYGTTNTYTLSGQLETTKDAESKNNNLPYFVKYEYNGLGQKVKETYSDETEISYTYNGTGNLLSSYVNGKQKGSAKYDLLGRVIQTKDGMGNITITKWNAFDKVAYVKTPDDNNTKSYPHPSKTTAFQYDDLGNLMYSKNSLGKINEYTYDFLNRQTSNTTRNEASSERITTTYGYDANGNKTYETDGNGNTINYTYNELNQLKSASINVSGKNKTTTYTYDANGNKISETDYQGNTTQYVYDGINRLVETIDATGTVIGQMEYNNANAQIRVYDALHNVTEYGYDKNLRQTYAEDGEGHITRQSYDNRGNVAAKTDGRYNITTYRYDAENRLKNVINPLGETTTYTYDNNGNMITQTDGNGNVTTYVYNAMNKLRKKIDPNGINNASKTESYKYRADGLLKSKVDRNRKKTTYTYDIFGRLLSENADGELKSYTYDNNGNLLTMTDSTGTTTRIYDEQNRVTAKTVPVIGQTIYQYDVPSNISGYIVEKTIDPKGNISEKTYDKVGRLYSVKTGDKTTKYTYYTNGNRKSIIYPEGTKETYTYYKDNKVKTLENLKSDGTVLQSYTYTYDAAENQTSKTTSDGTTIYEYDSLNRLEKVTEPNGKITSYSFDKAGNRKTEIVIVGENLTGTSYIYNEQNRLISAETKLSDKKTEKTIYEYDNNGNLKSKTKSIMTITDANTPTDIQNMPSFELEIIRSTDKGSGSQDLTLYSYDNFNRLIMLKEGSTTSIYNYNAEDYRTEKTINGETTLYLYESDKVILETDNTGNQLAKNVYGTNLLYRLVEEIGTSPEEKYYYMYNAHGDVTALISPNGEVKGTYDYDAFGNIISQTGDVNNNITYAGYQYDKETDLYYLNARYYDSKIARFITEDSYRGNANDPLSLNVYTYCHNEPIMYTDPTGHWEKGDSELSPEAQVQIAEATAEYIAAKKRGDEQGMIDAHNKAEEARAGNILNNSSLTKQALKNKLDYIMDSEYVSNAAKQDLNYSKMVNITRKSTNIVQAYSQNEVFISINSARLNSNMYYFAGFGTVITGNGPIGCFEGLANPTIEDILSRVPAGCKNIFKSDSNFSVGYRFKWTNEQGNWEIWCHEPSKRAPAGSNSSKGWTYRVRVRRSGNGKWYLKQDGAWVKENVGRENSPFYNDRDWNETHIPMQDPTNNNDDNDNNNVGGNGTGIGGSNEAFFDTTLDDTLSLIQFLQRPIGEVVYVKNLGNGNSRVGILRDNKVNYYIKPYGGYFMKDTGGNYESYDSQFYFMLMPNIPPIPTFQWLLPTVPVFP